MKKLSRYMQVRNLGKLRPNASLNVYVHAEDGYVEDHRYEPAHADAVGERPHVLDGEFSHIGAAYGAEQGAEYVDDDGEGEVEDEEERGPVVAVKVGQDCTLRRLDLDRTRSPSLRLNLDAKSTVRSSESIHCTAR